MIFFGCVSMGMGSSKDSFVGEGVQQWRISVLWDILGS